MKKINALALMKELGLREDYVSTPKTFCVNKTKDKLIKNSANANSRHFYIFINVLSVNPKRWSNKLSQFVANLPTNCLSVHDHFIKLELKELMIKTNYDHRIHWLPKYHQNHTGAIFITAFHQCSTDL